ncbi:MAG TPA: MerR family transcriptional regulator [Agriterribacter sp.]|nr:MerR family transcriptional regulator [Agriterribacter sp.]
MLKQLDLFGSVVETAKNTTVSAKKTGKESPAAVDSMDDDADIIENKEPPSVEMVQPAPGKNIKPSLNTTKKGKRGRKSIKDMSSESAFITIPDDEVLFKKQYYSIGEVAGMFNLNSSLLRYWETEFDILKPRKNRKGDRHFRPEDIKNLSLIHHLLRQRKYTIEGAKDYLKKNKNKAQQNFELIQRLEKLKGFLLELKAGL